MEMKSLLVMSLSIKNDAGILATNILSLLVIGITVNQEVNTPGRACSRRKLALKVLSQLSYSNLQDEKIMSFRSRLKR